MHAPYEVRAHFDETNTVQGGTVQRVVIVSDNR